MLFTAPIPLRMIVDTVCADERSLFTTLDIMVSVPSIMSRLESIISDTVLTVLVELLTIVCILEREVLLLSRTVLRLGSIIFVVDMILCAESIMPLKEDRMLMYVSISDERAVSFSVIVSAMLTPSESVADMTFPAFMADSARVLMNVALTCWRTVFCAFCVILGAMAFFFPFS